MDKVIRDGMVAVLYSPGYRGAAWYTWHHHLSAVFHPTLVALVEQNKHAEITSKLCKELFGDGYYGGSSDLKIKWVPVGTLIKITEVDGSESIEYRDLTEWITV